MNYSEIKSELNPFRSRWRRLRLCVGVKANIGEYYIWIERSAYFGYYANIWRHGSMIYDGKHFFLKRAQKSVLKFLIACTQKDINELQECSIVRGAFGNWILLNPNPNLSLYFTTKERARVSLKNKIDFKKDLLYELRSQMELL